MRAVCLLRRPGRAVVCPAATTVWSIWLRLKRPEAVALLHSRNRSVIQTQIEKRPARATGCRQSMPGEEGGGVFDLCSQAAPARLHTSIFLDAVDLFTPSVANLAGVYALNAKSWGFALRRKGFNYRADPYMDIDRSLNALGCRRSY